MRMYKHIRTAMWLVVLVFAGIGVYETFPFFYRAAWRTIGLPVFSGYYRMGVRNATDQPLVVDVYNINDRDFESLTHLRKARRARLGTVTDSSMLVMPDEVMVTELPSLRDFSMGRLLVVARSDFLFGCSLTQQVALYLLSPRDVMLKGQERSPVLEIKGDDFVKFWPEHGAPSDERMSNVIVLSEMLKGRREAELEGQ